MSSPFSTDKFSNESHFPIPYRTNSDLSYRSGSREGSSSQKSLVERLGKSAHVGLSALRTTVSLAPWDEDPSTLDPSLRKTVLSQVHSIRSQALCAKQQLLAFIDTVLSHCVELETQFQESPSGPSTSSQPLQSIRPSLTKSETLESEHGAFDDDVGDARSSCSSEQSWEEQRLDREEEGEEDGEKREETIAKELEAALPFSGAMTTLSFSINTQPEEPEESYPVTVLGEYSRSSIELEGKGEQREENNQYRRRISGGESKGKASSEDEESFSAGKKKSFRFTLWGKNRGSRGDLSGEAEAEAEAEGEIGGEFGESVGKQGGKQGVEASSTEAQLAWNGPSTGNLNRAQKVRLSSGSVQRKAAVDGSRSGSDSDPPPLPPRLSTVQSVQEVRTLQPVETRRERQERRAAAMRDLWETTGTEGWSCTVCTLCNDWKMDFCEACENPRPGSQPRRLEMGGRRGESGGRLGGGVVGRRSARARKYAAELAMATRPDWSCTACTLKNSARLSKCGACGTSRGPKGLKEVDEVGERDFTNEEMTSGGLLSPRRIVRMNSTASEGAYALQGSSRDGEGEWSGNQGGNLLRTSSEPVETALWTGRFGDPLYRATSIPEGEVEGEEGEDGGVYGGNIGGKERGHKGRRGENWASPDQILSPVTERVEEESQLFQVISQQFEEVQLKKKKEREVARLAKLASK